MGLFDDDDDKSWMDNLNNEQGADLPRRPYMEGFEIFYYDMARGLGVKTLNDYLSNGFNIDIYEEMLNPKSSKVSLTLEPLIFFHRLYTVFDFIKENKDKYLALISLIRGTGLTGYTEFFFIQKLYVLILESGILLNNSVAGKDRGKLEETALMRFFHKLEEKMLELDAELFIESIDSSPSAFTIDGVDHILRTYEGDTESQIAYLKWVIQHYKNTYPNVAVDDPFVTRCKFKIDNIREAQNEDIDTAAALVKKELEGIPNFRLNNSLLSFDYTPQQVESYFMQMAHHGFYTAEEINRFLKANFAGITGAGSVMKVKLPKVQNLNQKQLMFFVYQFYSLQTKRRFNKRDACRLLMDNFQYFEDIHEDTVYKSMQEAPCREYPFSSKMLSNITQS